MRDTPADRPGLPPEVIAAVQERRSVVAQLQRVVNQLELVSHVGASRLYSSPSGSTVDIGGRRPAGASNTPAEYFVRKAKQCHTLAHYKALLGEAEDTLAAWRRTPAPPEAFNDGSDAFRRRVVSAPGGVVERSKRFGVPKQTVSRWDRDPRYLSK